MADGTTELLHLSAHKPRGVARGMDPRAPETFVRIDISHPAENALVEQQGLDHGAPAGQALAEFLFSGLERVQSQPAKESVEGCL